MSWLIATRFSLSFSARASLSSVGSSLTHGAHQLAHKFTNVGLPAKAFRVVSLPSGSLKLAAGAAAPLWLRSAPLTGTPGSVAAVSLAGGGEDFWQAGSARSAQLIRTRRIT